MKANRIVRIMTAMLVLAIFLAYAYVRASYSPMSLELDSPKAEKSTLSLPEPTPEPTPEAVAAPVEPAQDAEPADGVIEAVPDVSEEPAATLDPNSPYSLAIANAAARGLPAPPDVDVTSWEFTLVNGEHSIGQYEPEQLAYLNQTADETDIQYSYNGYRCAVDARIAEPLLQFALGCKSAGLPVFLSSGYRSYSEQVANFQRVCQNNGVTDGKDANGHYITMPAGCSEHQLALCCDITDVYRPIKNAEIEKTETYQWLKAHCAEYGFIHRFPAGKEDITGVMYEPFHFRWVGTEAAAYMEQNQLCLEEFLALYGVA